ncbi:phosphate ABC transporter permease PstA [Herpetosiphon giganteus]|uniref:phosphate ABC transporter permease PstA n=1 Tax=Herpetosiphon giganteus TaxID=2029754 RepID=UPI00195A96D4|nr:phosphate ABC transporter permease PstA [Herpetosiphon giganteus]MBM7846573.1 phosphate transport system permease protein [Herpetosiphon giganteus]
MTTLNEDVKSGLPQGEASRRNVASRRRKGAIWRTIFLSATIFGLIALSLLIYNVANEVFGYVAIEYAVDPATVSDKPLDELSKDELVTVLQGNMRKNAFRTLENEKPMANRSDSEVYDLVIERVLKPQTLETWTLRDSWFNKAAIDAQVASDFPEAKLEFRSWISTSFLTTPMSSDPLRAGVRTALLGSLWMIAITILFAFPIGVGAAIYLEEYATDNRFNRIIQTNINNLAGVPSIIYGMLGLVIFVRTLEPITSGRIFGADSGNGRTIVAASLTMMLLILPIMIINGQEAIRAVPLSLRQASYGLGATKWQTIWHHVLPNALPGIFTGTILAISRAIGETAPLIVVGASTFIVTDPDGPFAKFTALPIQIYNWTSRPQPEFAHIAASAIVVLLVMLLSLNAIAVVLRNRFSKRG